VKSGTSLLSSHVMSGQRLSKVTSKSAIDRAKARQIERQRRNHEDRKREIIKAAIAFFSDVGFDGSLRDLATRLGITHQSLFRYFPTKEALVERVFEEVYLDLWQVEWEALLMNRAVPFPERLAMFYQAYFAATCRYNWVRIFVYASLKDVAIAQRYMALIQKKVIEPIGYGLRCVADLPEEPSRPLSPYELEVAWSLHGELFYAAIRKSVFNMSLPIDLKSIVECTVARFLAGTTASLRSRESFETNERYSRSTLTLRSS